MPTSAPPKPKALASSQSGQTPKQHAQAMARQILSEPSEILKSATQQISGVEVVKQTGAQIPQTGEQQGSQQQAELVIKEQNAQRHYQTYKHELDEMSINNMLARRDAERQEERQKEQIQKQQVIQKKNNPLTEPIAKIKRGMAGGMGMLGLKRKQRSAELVKTPSN